MHTLAHGLDLGAYVLIDFESICSDLLHESTTKDPAASLQITLE